jgi:hydrogenase maturation protein HypF
MSVVLEEKTMESREKRVRIEVTGRVQGVGFRPTVYQFATDLQLRGFVENSTEGVTIEIEGAEKKLSAFAESLKKNPPPLSKIETIHIMECDGLIHSGFQILESKNHGGKPYGDSRGFCAMRGL